MRQDADACAAGGKASWHETAASAGDPVAMYNLGTHLRMSTLDALWKVHLTDLLVRQRTAVVLSVWLMFEMCVRKRTGNTMTSDPMDGT